MLWPESNLISLGVEENVLESVKMEQKKYLYSLSPCPDLTFWIVCCVAFPLKMKPRVSESDEINSVDMMQNLTEHICTDTGFRYDTLFYSKPWRAIAEILYVNLRNSKPALLSRIKTDFFTELYEMSLIPWMVPR